MTGVTIDPSAWDIEQLPHHLRMNFAVMDEHGNTLAMGRDLVRLQEQLQGNVKQAIQRAVEQPEDPVQATDEWVFGHLPATLEKHHHGYADRKSTRLNSSHVKISYAVFCLKTKIGSR